MQAVSWRIPIHLIPKPLFIDPHESAPQRPPTNQIAMHCGGGSTLCDASLRRNDREEAGVDWANLGHISINSIPSITGREGAEYS